MHDLTALISPAAVAAVVSAAALIVRELMARRGERPRGDLARIESLWRETAAARGRESACLARCRGLEVECGRLAARVRQLEAELDALRRRLDRLGRPDTVSRTSKGPA